MKDEYGGGNTEKNLREPINGLVMKRNEKKWESIRSGEKVGTKGK